MLLGVSHGPKRLNFWVIRCSDVNVDSTSPIALLNNFFGRQFNSLNDVNIHPDNKDIYFTDTIYGYVQDFRPAPGLPNQVYRFNPDTGAVTIAADGFVHSNGTAMSQLPMFK